MRFPVRAAGLTAALLASTILVAPSVAVAEAAALHAEAAAAGPLTPAVAGVTAPKDFFPQEPGTDYYLINYDQYEAYLKALDGQSDRMQLQSFGTTEEGRTQWMAIVSTPENLANLDRYKEIARKLAKAEGVSEEDARQLAAEGKSVVWIDAGLHATETVTTQGQVHVLYRLLTGQDAETLRTLDDTIILFGHANPDGLQLVADWYMRKENPQERSFRDIPRLYQKYTGHDNNRDSYMASQAETTNINRVHYREWFPQIVYNQHQTGPRGMVVYIPPFRDPYNYNLDGLVMNMTSELGTTMHSRLVAEGKGGSGSNSVGAYSTWHNGMVRSTPYYHNAIGILTELIGGPTPEDIALIPDVQLARNDIPLPMAPRRWHLRDSIDYQWSMNRAILDYASRNRERLLFNIWRMGMNAIERGSTDTWQMTPTLVDRMKAAGTDARGAVDPALLDTVVRTPENRMPRGYIINPQTQRDLPATVAFLNTLIKNGVDVEIADQAFTVNGTRYPAGSYVVKTAQAYRPHVLDMFEPQDHPHNTEYPGGPPKLPYDVAGYTLAYQMGVNFDRIQDGFEAPTTKTADLLAPPPGRVIGNGRAGYVIGHEENNSFILTNRLLAAGITPEWIGQSVRANGETLGAGAIWVPASDQSASIIREAVGPLGIDAHAMSRKPAGEALALKPVRVGLVDRYGGVMSSGWTRFLLERYEFPFEVVYPQALDTEDLNAKYDVLVFTDTVAPALNVDGYRRTNAWPQPEPETIPAEMRSWLGEVSEQTVPRIAAFAQNGGTVVTIGNSNRLAHLLGAPIEPALVKEENGRRAPLSTTDFFLPGSVLSAKVDASNPLAYGMPQQADVFFNNGQTFRLTGDTARPVVVFDSATPLRSGWAHNQERLKDTTAVVDIDLGEGKLFAYGAEVIQRAQPHGTFRLFFNGLLYGPAQAARD